MDTFWGWISPGSPSNHLWSCRVLGGRCSPTGFEDLFGLLYLVPGEKWGRNPGTRVFPDQGGCPPSPSDHEKVFFLFVVRSWSWPRRCIRSRGWFTRRPHCRRDPPEQVNFKVLDGLKWEVIIIFYNYRQSSLCLVNVPIGGVSSSRTVETSSPFHERPRVGRSTLAQPW